DAADEPVEFAQRLHLGGDGPRQSLRELPAGERLAARLRRYRNIGLPRSDPDT
ncbi:hypothetical protein, partial [Mycobacterium colombiense]